MRSLHFSLFIALTITTGSVLADRKVLVCQNTLAANEVFLKTLPEYWSAQCAKDPKDKVNCQRRDDSIARVDLCRKSGLTYSHKKTFSFDENILKGEYGLTAEGFTESCWGSRTSVEDFKVEVAAPTAKFLSKGTVVTVNMQTMKGEFGGGSYDCEFETSAAQKTASSALENIEAPVRADVQREEAALARKKKKDDDVNKAKAAVGSSLKDPMSVQWRDLSINGDYLCGELNAKNSYGGYGGFTKFYIDFSKLDAQINNSTNSSFDIMFRALCYSVNPEKVE